MMLVMKVNFLKDGTSSGRGCHWGLLLMGPLASHMVGDVSKRGVVGVSRYKPGCPQGSNPRTDDMAGASSDYAQNPLYAERVNLRGLGRLIFYMAQQETLAYYSW